VSQTGPQLPPSYRRPATAQQPRGSRRATSLSSQPQRLLTLVAHVAATRNYRFYGKAWVDYRHAGERSDRPQLFADDCECLLTSADATIQILPQLPPSPTRPPAKLPASCRRICAAAAQLARWRQLPRHLAPASSGRQATVQLPPNYRPTTAQLPPSCRLSASSIAISHSSPKRIRSGRAAANVRERPRTSTDIRERQRSLAERVQTFETDRRRPRTTANVRQRRLPPSQPSAAAAAAQARQLQPSSRPATA